MTKQRTQTSWLVAETSPSIQILKKLQKLDVDALKDTAEWLAEYSKQRAGVEGLDDVSKAFSLLSELVERQMPGEIV